MASNYIKVSTSRLYSDASNIEAQIAKMKNELARMKTAVNELNAMWDGPSQEAFVKAITRDMNALQDVINSLSSINRYENYAKSKYEHCENQVSQLVNSIRIS